MLSKSGATKMLTTADRKVIDSIKHSFTILSNLTNIDEETRAILGEENIVEHIERNKTIIAQTLRANIIDRKEAESYINS